MKTAVLALVAGCAAPIGTAQTWPPALGITISAAAFADLDGDGTLDIAIAATGSRAGEGLYLVRGGSDWDGSAIASFTRFVPHPLADVAALAVVGGALVLAVDVKGDATLETLDLETLATLATSPLAIPTKQHLAIASVPFPFSAPHAVVLGDADVVDVDLTGGAPVAFAPPTGPHWPLPQTAVGFWDGHIAIATATQVESAMLGPPPISFAPTRPDTDTTALIGQIAATLANDAGDPVAAIIGVDAPGQQVCAIDLQKVLGAACLPITVTPGARIAVAAGAVDGQTGTVLAILATTDTDTTIQRFTDLVLDDGVLTGQALGPLTHATLAAPIATFAPGHLFALGISGETACLDATDC